MEAGVEAELALDAGQVGYSVGDGVPLAGEFFGGGFRGWLYGVSVYYQGVQVDHVGVGVEEGEDGFAGYAGGEGRYGCEVRAFGHFVGGLGRVVRRVGERETRFFAGRKKDLWYVRG